MHSGESAEDDMCRPCLRAGHGSLTPATDLMSLSRSHGERDRGRMRYRNWHLVREPQDELSVTYKSKICVVVAAPCSSRTLKNGSPASGLQRKCISTSCDLTSSSFSIISEARASKQQEGQPSCEDACTVSYDMAAVQES